MTRASLVRTAVSLAQLVCVCLCVCPLLTVKQFSSGAVMALLYAYSCPRCRSGEISNRKFDVSLSKWPCARQKLIQTRSSRRNNDYSLRSQWFRPCSSLFCSFCSGLWRSGDFCLRTSISELLPDYIGVTFLRFKIQLKACFSSVHVNSAVYAAMP